MGKHTRRDHGTPQANGHAEAEEARRARAATGQGAQADGAPEAEADVTFTRTTSALKRLVTEPGQTWVLEGEAPAEADLRALGAWSQTCGVTLLIFSPQERFSLLSTQPGDTVLLFTHQPERLNQPMLSAWAQSRGLALAVMPPEASVQHLDDATLDALGLQRKPRLLVLPSGAGAPPDLRRDGA